MPPLLGTVINAVAIILGGLGGLIRNQPLSAASESFFKVALSAFTVFYGLKLTVTSLHGSALQILKQILVATLALGLGRWTGSLLRLQQISNGLGQRARALIETAKPGVAGSFGKGFDACAILFCAAPLGIIGAIEDGIQDYFYPLAVKGVIDGLATLGLARVFGFGVALSALPVFVFQGTISLSCAEWVKPLLQRAGCFDAVNVTAGLLIFSVALVMLQLKRIALADYLPSLVYAGVIGWIWK
jgi:uncharacterized protein